MKKQKTRDLKKAVEGNQIAEDTNLTIFTDSFEENVLDALTTEFNREEFEMETNQSFFLSKNMCKEKITSFLLEKGVKQDKIKHIKEWKEIPVSLKKIQIDYIIEFFIFLVLKELKGKNIETQGRIIYLYSMLLRDLKNENPKFKNITPLLMSEIKEESLLADVIIECEEERTEVLEMALKLRNKTVEFLHVDNEIEEDVYYLIELKNEIEYFFMIKYLRAFQNMRDHSLNNKERKENGKRKSYYVELSDFLIEGIAIYAATEIPNMRQNLFLNNESYEKGLYLEDELISMKFNTSQKYGKNQTSLRDFLLPQEFESEESVTFTARILEKIKGKL